MRMRNYRPVFIGIVEILFGVLDLAHRTEYVTEIARVRSRLQIRSEEN